MSAKDPVGILIPSVFVSDITGVVIKENYLYDQLYFVLINDDLPFNINTHLLLPFAIVVGICFLIIVIFMVSRSHKYCAHNILSTLVPIIYILYIDCQMYKRQKATAEAQAA